MVNRHLILALHLLLLPLVHKRSVLYIEVDSIPRESTIIAGVDILEVVLFQLCYVDRKARIQEVIKTSVDEHQLRVRQNQLQLDMIMERKRTRRRRGRNVHRPRERRKRCQKGMVLLDPRADTRARMGIQRVVHQFTAALTDLVLLIALLLPVQRPLVCLPVLLTKIMMRV